MPDLIKRCPDLSKALDNQRVQIMLGILTSQGKAKETIPDSGNKSMFSCERYKFFLDAPFEICNLCCNVMKKEPAKRYEKETGRKPMLAQMASESRLRAQQWINNGCNGFELGQPKSNPMAFWTEQDVLLYIHLNELPICSVYGDIVEANQLEGQMSWADMGLFEIDSPTLETTGADRTGCMFCGFGCHRDKQGNGRFLRMKETHPKQYEYIMKPWDKGGLGYKEVIDWINEHGNLHIEY